MYHLKLAIMFLFTALTVTLSYGQSNESYEISDTISFEGNYSLWITDYSSKLNRYIGFDFFTKEVLQYSSEGELIKIFESKSFIRGSGTIMSLGYYQDSLIIIEGIANTTFFSLDGDYISQFEEDDYINPGSSLRQSQHVTINEELYMYRSGGYNTEFSPGKSQFYLEAKLVKQNIFNKPLTRIKKYNYTLHYPETSVYRKHPGSYPAIYPQLLSTQNNIISILPFDATVHYAAHNNLNEFKSKKLMLTNFEEEIKSMDFGIGMGMDDGLGYKNEQLNPSIQKIFQTDTSENYVIHYQSGIPYEAIVTKRTDHATSSALRDHYLHITDEHFNSILEKDILLPSDIKEITYVHSLDRILCPRFNKDDPDAQNQYYILKLK